LWLLEKNPRSESLALNLMKNISLKFKTFLKGTDIQIYIYCYVLLPLFYSFGLMDASELVKASIKWKTVPFQENCTVSSSDDTNPPIPPVSVDSYAINATSCDYINFIEHIQVSINLESMSRRGDLSVILRSPAGTFSTLLAERPYDETRYVILVT
jgi:hypothetical protein